MPWSNFNAAGAGSAGGEEHEPVSTDDPVLGHLSRAAREGRTTTLLSLSHSASARGRVRQVRGQHITLSLLDGDADLAGMFGALSGALLVTVSGRHADIVSASVMRSPTLQDGAWLVMLEVGNELLRTDARRAYRVPVLPESELQVLVRDQQGRRLRLVAEDVSQAGLGGELVEAPPGALPAGSTVQVAMRCAGTGVKVSLPAEVRARRDRFVGLFFPGVWHRGELEPPAELRSIVRQVEQTWIRRQGTLRAS